MLEFFTQPKDARVAVVEPQVALRSAIVEAVRANGFAQVSGFGDLKTLLNHLISENCDWVLVASGTSADVNILQLLKLGTEEPRLRKTRISLLMREHEKDLLPLAFELGLLSFHMTNIPSRIAEDIADLLRTLRAYGYDGTLTAANYLVRVLKEKSQWGEIINLQKSLLELFPAASHVLLTLAEAQLNAGIEEGYRTLQQVALIDPSVHEEVEQIRQRFPDVQTLESNLDLDLPGAVPSQNVLGVNSCLLVDPDTSIHLVVKQCLVATGLSDIVSFESGLAAWNWIKQGNKPGIVLMEWKIPELGGLQLVQRLRQQFPSVPIILLTSLVMQTDTPLLREIGVNGMVEKPFEGLSMLSEIVSVLQQHRAPTEQTAMERKILQCIHINNKVEASRLLATLLTHRQFTEIGKLRMEAEFAYFEGQYQSCCQLAMEGLKISHDSVELLNLLGKSLMKLGDFVTALRFLEKAHTISPRNLERICRMSNVCVELGRQKDAEAYLSEAKGLDPHNILVTESEANMAIETQDTPRATKALDQVENLHRIVAFTNNKAVAKIRNNQFADGIALYQTALESLPKPWGALHDTVSFNLALAYIRNGDYAKALAALEPLKADASSNSSQKAEALIRKVEHAIKTETLLQFHIEPSQNDGRPTQTAAIMPFDSKAVLDSLMPTRGDICCYRLFQARELAPESIRKFLQNMPRFKQGNTSHAATKSSHS